MEFEKTLALRKPVALGELSFDTLQLREPTAGELERASVATTSVGVVIDLVSLVAKVPRRAVENLCQRDLQDVTSFFGRFSTFEPTGETESQT